jgi:hypothetical protein
MRSFTGVSQFQQKATPARKIEIFGSYRVVIRETRGRQAPFAGP